MTHAHASAVLIVAGICCGVAAINQWLASIHRRRCEEIRKEVIAMNDAWRRGEYNPVEWTAR